MFSQTNSRQPENGASLRILFAVALSLAIAVVVNETAGANDAGVTDFTLAQPDAIEPFDIVSALAPARGTRIEPGAPPTVRLPILFEFNSANLRPEGRVLLDKLGVALVTPELGSFHFVVEGHTDSVGSASYNERLSHRRASAVKNYLTNTGVPTGRLDSQGMGEKTPVADNDSSEGRQRNRRVEIINLGDGS